MKLLSILKISSKYLFIYTYTVVVVLWWREAADSLIYLYLFSGRIGDLSKLFYFKMRERKLINLRTSPLKINE